MTDSWSTTQASFKLYLSSDPIGVRAEIIEGNARGGWFATAANAREAILHAVAMVPQDRLPSSGIEHAVEKPTLNLASDAEVAREAWTPSRIAVSRPDILRLLEDAAGTETVVRISGRKVDGGRYDERRVRVSRIESRRVGFGHPEKYLKCVDLFADEARTFRVDGIEQAQTERAV